MIGRNARAGLNRIELAAVILIACGVVFGLLYLMSWILWLVLAEFKVKTSLWICMLIWLVIGWIGSCFKGKD